MISVLSLSLGLLACGGTSNEKSAAADGSKSAESPKKSGKTCQLKSFRFFAGHPKSPQGRTKKTVNYEYDKSGKIIKAVAEGDEKDVGTYTYDEKGRLSVCDIPPNKNNQNKGLNATYVYEGDRLVEIKGGGVISPRSFVYNEQGLIWKQITSFNGKPYSTTTFEYNDQGDPVKATTTSNTVKAVKPKIMMAYELTYADKKNPFIGLSIGNSTELFLGYPVGNHTKLLVDKKSLTKGGMQAKEQKFEYNDQGYPVKITDPSDPETGISTLSYDCF